MKRLLVGLGLIGAILAAGWPAPVAAHPLGNFTVNRYSRIELTGGQIRVHYVLDLAEIPAFQESNQIDRDRDGQVDPDERAAYLTAKVESIRRNLTLTLNNSPVELRAINQDLSFPPGQGGLTTLRLVADLTAPLGAGRGRATLDYRDDNQPDRIGWREIVIVGGDGAAMTDSTVDAVDRSAELTAYPQDMLSSPSNQRQARATFELTEPVGGLPSERSRVAAAAGAVRRGPLDQSVERLTGLVTAPEVSPLVLALALIAALGLGALHAFSPGHGKTVVGAYLVGSRGTARHALFLGLTVTLTHTAGVFALGLVTLAASRFIVPERLYPWLSLISGVLVVAIGLGLFATRFRAYRRRPVMAATESSHPVEFDHHHHHQHQPADPTADHAHHPADHSHGPGGAHHHTLPGADGRPIGWRSLLALGISGGLLPCPSALVVLLSAISLHRVGFGLLLILTFSAGLAGVLTGIGLALVYARRLFVNLPTRGRLVALLPLASALVVAGLGCAIAGQAIGQLGGWRL